MWGALSLLMTLIPSFRDFRFLNVIALAGTAFTAIYICVSAGVHGFQHNAVNLAPYNFQSFFTGANVFLWAYGGHGVSFEAGCSPTTSTHAAGQIKPPGGNACRAFDGEKDLLFVQTPSTAGRALQCTTLATAADCCTAVS